MMTNEWMNRAGGHVSAPKSVLSVAPDPDATRGRVLVVDDEAGFRSLVVDILGDEGYETREAEDGLSALDVLRHWTPNLILLDLSMPRMNGWQFLEARDEMGLAPNVPVIVLSASRHIDERVSSRHTVLAKPFEVEAFLATLRDSLR